MKRFLTLAVLIAVLIPSHAQAATDKWYGKRCYVYANDAGTKHEEVCMIVNMSDITGQLEGLVQWGYDSQNQADSFYLEQIDLFRNGSRVEQTWFQTYYGPGPDDRSTGWYGCGSLANFYAKATFTIVWNANGTETETHGPVSFTVSLDPC